MDFLSIEDVKALDIEDASKYCNNLRQYIIDTLENTGGHLASNLGIAEISLGLIRVFSSPNDKIIYDVGHQSYVHKLLTERYFNSDNLRKFGGYSGFTKTEESRHDPFGAGHSSTALSAAVGFARANTLKGEDNYSIAVIGDGAFCNGMTFEALNNVNKDDKLIIVLNDNEMSISKNVGSMSRYLNKIRLTSRYISLKNKTKSFVSKLPILSKSTSRLLSKIKNTAKRHLIGNTIFDDLGIYYLGPADGNDLKTVELLLEQAKRQDKPVIIHFLTQKGKGYAPAESEPNKYHFVKPISQGTAEYKTFSSEFSSILTDYADSNSKVVAVTAAMSEGTGLDAFKNKHADRFFDVGISEEHAVTFSAAMGAAGYLPYFAVYSTFFQRSYDQIIHDVALQNIKMTIALDRAGLVGSDGPTHHGVFDVSMLLNVPGVTLYSPSTFDELLYSFNKTKDYNGLSVLRYPKGTESVLVSKFFQRPSDFSIDSLKQADVLLVTYGRIAEEVIKAKVLLEARGVSVVVLKFVKLKPIDYRKVENLIASISPKHSAFIEEGMRIGGFCENLVANINLTSTKDIIAIDETFVPHGNVAELFDFCGLSHKKIYDRVLKWI